MDYYKFLYVIIFVLIVLTTTVAFYFFLGSDEIEKNVKKIYLGNSLLNVEIADDPVLWYQGLSDRERICDQCGMLFVFPDKKERTFVMREMKFPLDIIWINDNKIVKIDKNLTPEGKIINNYYNSPEPLNFVLEVNAGYADRVGLHNGDKVELP